MKVVSFFMNRTVDKIIMKTGGWNWNLLKTRSTNLRRPVSSKVIRTVKIT